MKISLGNLVLNRMTAFALLAVPFRMEAQTLESMSNRLDGVTGRLPVIIQSAERAAVMTIENTSLLINVPYAPQPGFAEEMVNRSGSLANALPTDDRPRLATPKDILLYSVRSWEVNGADARKRLAALRDKHSMIVLFASKAGVPDDIAFDDIVDNGAEDGSGRHAPINAIVNVLNGWLWQCEYAAALSRLGYHPGILQSILEPDGKTHNAAIQKSETRNTLFKTASAVSAGELGGRYLNGVGAIVRSVGAQPVQSRIREASGLLAAHVKDGKDIRIATSTHILMSEIFHDYRAPWKPFNVVWRASTAFRDNLKPDDLLVWFSFVGISSPLEDYGRFIADTGVEYIACFLNDTRESSNEGRIRVHIPMSWSLPDSAVEIPFPPGRMAPVSGINQALVYRCLDDAVFDLMSGRQ